MFITCALTLLVGMASTSGDATPPSPKTTRLMAEMIKLGDQMKRMSYEDEKRMGRMRKKNEESLGSIHRSCEALSVRIENIERKREANHLILLMKNMRGMKRMRKEGGMRGIGREEIIEDMEVDKERKGLRE